MDLKVLKSFIDLAKQEGVAELKYETKDIKISVNLSSAPSLVQPVYQATTAPITSKSSPENKQNSNFHEIKSPFVGTFYTSSAPGKPTFVKVGDKVSKGQTLCILEAMKIMNEIECDVTGEIVEICLENESLVEYGQVLFRVKK
jgi:acetyl-CoA carboxylase biotin carboxyl carrier protein